MPIERIHTVNPEVLEKTAGDQIIMLIADDEKMLCEDIAFNIEEIYPCAFDFYCVTQASEVGNACRELQPRVLILDKLFNTLQNEESIESGNMQKFAERFRADFPESHDMAIVIYSLFTQVGEAAEYSNIGKLHGIWSFPKSMTNSRLARFIMETVLPQWPRDEATITMG
jgi:hypothetical protein